jgi:hypothetical protein
LTGNTKLANFPVCHLGGKLTPIEVVAANPLNLRSLPVKRQTTGTLKLRHARNSKQTCSLPVCHYAAARSANWHSAPVCQLATLFRVASGTHARQRPSGTVRQGLFSGWRAGRSGTEARRTEAGRKLDNAMTTAETAAHRYRQNAMLPIRKCKSLKTLSGVGGMQSLEPFHARPSWKAHRRDSENFLTFFAFRGKTR